MRAAAVWVLLMVCSCDSADAVEVQARSGPQRSTFVELYTSEGCSSCPPADERFSVLLKHPDLWRGVVPVAFHVDYWDYLGWKDRFSSATHTRRQRDYAARWGKDSVYTPMLVIDGREDRSWNLYGIVPGRQEAGILEATSDASTAHVKYTPPTGGKSWVAHAAILGSGLRSRPSSGENTGQLLHHDFAVLTSASAPLRLTDGMSYEADLSFGSITEGKDARKALAVWVTEEGGTEAVQCAGNYWPQR
ncbi:MAG: hypothetical protein MOGMAGMI_02147 [Candidatus Omnitrophica bacterium]|nr:hypothetical protein [Candidatus Omnitrophota bacterium]